MRCKKQKKACKEERYCRMGGIWTYGGSQYNLLRSSTMQSIVLQHFIAPRATRERESGKYSCAPGFCVSRPHPNVMSEILRRWLHDDVGVQHPVDTFEEVSVRCSHSISSAFFFFSCPPQKLSADFLAWGMDFFLGSTKEAWEGEGIPRLASARCAPSALRRLAT